MENPAPTNLPLHDLLKRRWSPRAFSDRAIEAEKLSLLLEAARWAPSCFNEQPWRFVVASKRETEAYQRLLACLVEANRRWAQHAPVLMLSVASLRFERNGNRNRHALHDVGLAVENLVIQATALGLAVHQMAGFDQQRAREELAVPEGFEPVAAMAIGYPGPADSLPDDLSERELAPRSRKPLEDLVFTGVWGEPLVS